MGRKRRRQTKRNSQRKGTKNRKRKKRRLKEKRKRQKKVSVRMTLNIDYQQLSTDDKDTLKGKLRDSLAESAGVDQAAVSVKLMEGSVKVDAEIQAPDANSVEAVEKSIKDSKTQLQSRVVEAANSIPGVKAAANGELNVEGLEVKTKEELDEGEVEEE